MRYLVLLSLLLVGCSSKPRLGECYQNSLGYVYQVNKVGTYSVELLECNDAVSKYTGIVSSSVTSLESFDGSYKHIDCFNICK